MRSKARLRYDVLQILKEHRILNTMEVCRLLNSREKRDVDYCYKGQGFTFGVRGWDKLCQKQFRNCEIGYKKTYYILSVLLRKKFLLTTKMRFYDTTKNRHGKCNDIFRFWYLNKKEFEAKILRQTLIPYVEIKN